MKILDVLREGMTWNGVNWIGGASDEGHNDFDPFQRERGGRTYRPSPRRATAPVPFVAIRVPFAVKDAFKEVVGKGNYAWDGDHKTWKIKASLLTPELRQRLSDMGIEVPR